MLSILSELAGKQVLVVDDEAAIRRSLFSLLDAVGCKVLAAEDGNQALELLAAKSRDGETVDAMITDVVMPGMDGEELISHTKKLYPQIPVLVITGYVYYESDSARESLGCSHVLIKPFDSKEFFLALQKSMHGSESDKA